jgi:hypothetical protein
MLLGRRHTAAQMFQRAGKLSSDETSRPEMCCGLSRMSWASTLRIIPRKHRRPRGIEAIQFAELPLSEPARFEAVVASGAATLRREIELKASGFLDNLPASTATIALASLLCHALKPYGAGSLPDLPSMLAAATLDCSNYGLLAVHVSRVLEVDIDTHVKVHFIGWQSEAIGNHQMLFAAMRKTGEGALILDPTVGVIAKASFDWIASQRPLPTSKILAFHQQPILDTSRDRVVEALIQGRLKPSELLYYFESEEHLVDRFGAPIDWPTPGAIAWRREYLR